MINFSSAKKILSQYYLSLLACIFLFAFYLAMLPLGNEIILDTTSTLLYFLIAFLFFTAIKRSPNNNSHWHSLFLLIVFWAACELFWALGTFLNMGQQYKNQISLFYIFSNLMLLISISKHFFEICKKLEYTKILVDICTICIIFGSFFFIFSDTNQTIQAGLNQIIFSLYFIFDFAILSILLVMYFSIKKSDINLSTFLVMVGTFIFALTDIYVTYKEFVGKDPSNTLPEIIYIVAFLMFALAAIFENNDIELFSFDKLKEHNNIPMFKFSKWFTIVPIAWIVLLNEINTFWITFYLIVFLIHTILSYYIESNAYKTRLLEQERGMQDELKKEIKKHTRDLTLANNRLTELVQKDELTKLYNRRYFMEKLNDLLVEQAEDESKLLAVYYLDLNRFKSVNDSYGHYIGDKVLIHMAQEFSDILPENSVLARLGGDEFIITTRNFSNKEQILDFARQILAASKKHIDVEGYRFSLGSSIGIAVANSLSDTNSLMKEADIAMYEAKNKNNMIAIFNEEMSNKIYRKNEIEHYLGIADFDDEFELYYQPQYNINTKKLVGGEALLRWHSSVKGMISPGEFIPIAEESNLIVKIGSWTLKRAVKQMAIWNKKYQTNLRIGINVSPKQIDSVNFADKVFETANEFSLNKSCVDIEITELSWMKGDDVLQGVFSMFKDANVFVSIDDFGTGYSSLNYIKKYKISKIKIAKELVDNIYTNTIDYHIVKAIIDLAKAMKIKTIAEGVELEEQLEILKELGCDELQGYLWGKPMPASEFEKLIQKAV